MIAMFFLRGRNKWRPGMFGSEFVKETQFSDKDEAVRGAGVTANIGNVTDLKADSTSDKSERAIQGTVFGSW